MSQQLDPQRSLIDWLDAVASDHPLPAGGRVASVAAAFAAALVEKDGIKLTVATKAASARERGAVAARVRASTLEKLRSEGLAFTPE